MIGRYDEAANLRPRASRSMTYAPPQRLVIFEGGNVPASEVAFPILNAWLDETMGPVKPE